MADFFGRVIFIFQVIKRINPRVLNVSRARDIFFKCTYTQLNLFKQTTTRRQREHRKRKDCFNLYNGSVLAVLRLIG